jgi:hypothetical protein
MNTGLRDVINFAWKLPLVINGIVSEDLLRSYQAERDAHAHDLVEWAVSIGRLMDHLAAVEAAERAGEAAPEMPSHLRRAGYGQGREQPPLRTGVLVEDQVRPDGATGYLFSQPIVGNGTTEQRLDDLLGAGFSIVAKTENDLGLSSESRVIAAKIGITLLSLEGLSEVRGHFDRVFEFADAVIVRPDRYVFGHPDAQRTLDNLVALLADKLHLIN